MDNLEFRMRSCGVITRPVQDEAVKEVEDGGLGSGRKPEGGARVPSANPEQVASMKRAEQQAGKAPEAAGMRNKEERQVYKSIKKHENAPNSSDTHEERAAAGKELDRLHDAARENWRDPKAQEEYNQAKFEYAHKYNSSEDPSSTKPTLDSIAKRLEKK